MNNNQGFFARLKQGLNKTRNSFLANLETVFASSRIDQVFYDDLEDSLIMADVGMDTASFLLDKLKQTVKEKNLVDPAQLRPLLVEEIKKILATAASKPFDFGGGKQIHLVVGVNGVGKTTTIAKLAARFRDHRRQVLLVAADTFRAAATEQLRQWGERLQIPVIHHQEGADPGAVVFDGLAAAKARKTDIVIVDTAGRLHTKVNLMDELKKVKRIILQNLGDRQLETLLVLDATTGQNALNQVKIFHEAVGVDRIAITKLDGTAKGGIILAIINQFKTPISLIGVGEKKEDLQDFDPAAFAEALFEVN
ncbi:MAG: signal recognition particle-docking protein FtsY [Firmicutes bacterium]|nr:signal recognition particle-docking protein FtsY [Bacillota bacterium]